MVLQDGHCSPSPCINPAVQGQAVYLLNLQSNVKDFWKLWGNYIFRASKKYVIWLIQYEWNRSTNASRKEIAFYQNYVLFWKINSSRLRKQASHMFSIYHSLELPPNERTPCNDLSTTVVHGEYTEFVEHVATLVQLPHSVLVYAVPLLLCIARLLFKVLKADAAVLQTCQQMKDLSSPNRRQGFHGCCFLILICLSNK